MERSEAALHLARWYAFQHNFTRALDCLIFARVIDPSRLLKKDHRLLEVDCLLRMGHIQEARKILDQELENTGYDADFYLAYANTYVRVALTNGSESDAARLEWINRIYTEKGLLPLAKSDPLRPLAINNLLRADHQPKAKDRLRFRSSFRPITRGIRFQLPWRVTRPDLGKLEIIVVDDCSSDDTFAVAESYARQDPRVKCNSAIRKPGRRM